MAAADALISTTVDGRRLVVRAAGRWVVAAAGELDPRLREVERAGANEVTFDLGGLEAIDTAGAWLVVRTQRRLAAAGRQVELANLGADFAPLMKQVGGAGECRPVPHPRHCYASPVGFVTVLGDAVIRMAVKAKLLIGFLGLVAIAAARTVRHPRRLRFTSLLAQMEQTGVDALPIVGLLAFLIGIVVAYQGADQLRRFGAEIYTVNLLALSVLREMGVLLTAIIIAGRSGSAFTAQIGTMKVNEEVDAMQTLGLDPIEVLVLPRVFGLLITLPLLTIFANFLGLFGGAVMAWFTLDLTFPGFLRQLKFFLPGATFWIGVIKAPFFAGIIALIGCYEGLRTERSAESVGKLTTLSVVEAIFVIIVADAAFSILFSVLGV